MKIHNQTYVSFVICILLYLTCSENAFCYGRETNYLIRTMRSLFVRNKYFNGSGVGPTEDPTAAPALGPIGAPNAAILSVVNFGAKGDGKTDDSQAFLKAWNAACTTRGATMYVPANRIFLLQTITFLGTNCQPNVIVQVDGNIVAPADRTQWRKIDTQWILFQGLNNGLIIRGNGVIDGRGASFWTVSQSGRPHTLKITKGVNVTVTGITIKNSPQMHLFVDITRDLHVSGITLSSSGDSPNTDGIHISRVVGADIRNCTIGTGDDCISIQNGCSGVNIQNVNCGPGHGYSIGGLGFNNTSATVQNIGVYHSTVQNALNGVRIKTWPGGTGLVNNVTFSDIVMTNVANPVVIDQNYCNGSKNCPVPNKNAVTISRVTFSDIRGTYTKIPVSLQCSQFQPCTSLIIDGINLTPSSGSGTAAPVCFNARGTLKSSTTPPLNQCVLA